MKEKLLKELLSHKLQIEVVREYLIMAHKACQIGLEKFENEEKSLDSLIEKLNKEVDSERETDSPKRNA